MEKILDGSTEKGSAHPTIREMLRKKDLVAAIGTVVIVSLSLIWAFEGWVKVEKWCVQIRPDGSQEVVYEADCQK